MTIRDARNGKLYDLSDDGKRLTVEVPGAYGVTTSVTFDKAELLELLEKKK